MSMIVRTDDAGVLDDTVAVLLAKRAAPATLLRCLGRTRVDNAIPVCTMKNERKRPQVGAVIVALVPGGGIEPPLCCQNWILSPARLPIPPSRLWETSKVAHSARRRARPDIAHAM
jgi:hypothetical protein